MSSLPLLSGTAILLCCVTTLNAEKSFDFDSTPGKLPKQVVPQQYSIRIQPDIEKLSFSGSETVKLNVRQPVQRLVLNSLDLKITDAAVDGKKISPSAIKLDPKEETLTIPLLSELSAGPHELSLSFTGKINERGQGLFYARYMDQGIGRAEEDER